MILALAGGTGWGLCHGIEARPLLAAVALVPLVLILGSRRPFLFGWLHGTIAWCVAIPWIVPTITTYGQLDGWLAALALVLLAAILGFYDGLFGLVGARLWRRSDFASLTALPALWVALEWVRAWLLSGFPWNLAAYAWTDLPGALQLSSWVGAYGVSGLVVLPSVCVAVAVARRRWEPAALALLIPAALLAVAARFAVTPDPPAASRPRHAIQLVQPNTPNRPFFDATANQADYRRLLEMSATICEPGRLVVWPESAAWPRAWQDDPGLRWEVEQLARRGCAILFNSAYTEGEKTFNSVLLVERSSQRESAADGLRVSRADKRHLVPFGEYVPLRGLLPWLGKIARMAGDFAPADAVSPIAWDGLRLGAAVCFEVVFPGETAALVDAGASALVTVTNDAWYGDTAAPRQHLRAARYRAAENRRWLLRAAITGISAVVAPDGALVAVLPVSAQGTLAAEIVARDDRSPYTRAPRLVPLLSIAWVAAAWLRALRARRARIA